MIQNPMAMPNQVKERKAYQPQNITLQPSYNAVKIDIHNPQVNTGSQAAAAPVTAPVYSYPKAPVYDVPKTSVYEPKKTEDKEQPKAKEIPAIPMPVVVKPMEPAPAVVASTDKTVEAPAMPKVETPAPAAVSDAAKVAEPKKVEIKEPETAKPKVDLNEFITKLNDKNYDVQANAMEEIANMAQTQPKKATELLDVKVVDTLIGIMNSDSTKLEGPSAKQLEIREKIIQGKKVSDAENAEANKITPMELAERNKQFAIYTVAILQKLYGTEVEKLSNSVVPMTELPGAAAIVEQVKSNPNPMVRASGIDALSYIQRPEYKQDLSTLFSVAQKDQDSHVQKAATKALEKLSQVAAPAEAKPEAKAEDKKEEPKSVVK